MISEAKPSISTREIDAFRSEVEKWRSRFNTDERDEIVSETLTSFAKAHCAGQQILKPSRWLLSAAKFVAKNLRRKWAEERRSRIQYLNDKIVADARQGRLGKPIHRGAISQKADLGNCDAKANAAVATALARLSEDQREIVRLCIVGEYKVSEAADILGVCRSTAKSWLDRAKERLSKELS